MAKRTYASEERAEAAKEKAAKFLETVLRDPDRADELRAESLDDWLSRTKRKIVEKNSRCLRLVSPDIVERTARREVKMPRETRADVEADRDELLDKVEELRDLADDILSQYEEPEEEGESEEDDGEDDK
jgi:acyl-CoA synthetase (NDP forming)